MKITIITVTYNSARTLTRAIRSVERQNYPDVEYIIVDGESADTTLNIIKEHVAQYSNIRYISEPDNGIYDAINKGIEIATGDIIGILNSDDELVNCHILTDIVQRMTEDDADILYGDLVYCKYDAIEHNPPRVIRYWKSNPFNEKDLRKGWMPPHPTLYCRKEVFHKVGKYRTDFRISADYEFTLRAFSQPEFQKIYMPEVIVKMETGGISNRDMRSIWLKMKEDQRVIQLHGLNPLITLLYKNLRKIRQFIRH